MGIILGLMSTSITILGLIMAYIWRSNGKMQARMMTALERIGQGQERIIQIITQGQRDLIQGQERLEQIMTEGLERIAQIQTQGQKDIAQMLANQAKILERIESRA